jgi:hypothetical protein
MKKKNFPTLDLGIRSFFSTVAKKIISAISCPFDLKFADNV